MNDLYTNIAARTGGNIYIGVVGPVRTGKSTLIKRLMEQLVIPNIQDPFRAERARDELPQSGSGKTIMTSEPKFVPEEAVEISPDGSATLRIRMIDSVGYMVEGAVGATEDGEPRMVATPWYDHEIPMTEAAELGTRKVMDEHCTIGLVVTTDGSITDIPRQDYVAAEERAIRDMQATGKPFLVVINSANPASREAHAVKEHLDAAYGIDSTVADCQALDSDSLSELLMRLLYAFPMTQLQVRFPRWMDTLEWSHPVKNALCQCLLEQAKQIKTLGSAQALLEPVGQLPQVQDFTLQQMDLGTGTVICAILFPEALFYEILSSKTGMTIENDGQLMALLTQLSEMKKEYDKISEALSSVKATGYGIVMPGADEMQLQTPEVLKKNGAYGVRLQADAPSIHMIRVDLHTQISPMVGDEQQSKDLIAFLMDQDPSQLWESNIFGKSVYALIQEGLTAKLLGMSGDVREKFRGTLGRIVNEGANGLFCLIL